jgi:imidazolonepropionase-like amidohydrolase
VMRYVLMALAACLSAPVPAAETTAFVNVDVVPMTTEGLSRQQTVVVRGDRIVAVGPVDRVPIPEHALVVDGTDRYLMPGLAEMHAHVPAADDPALGRYFALYVANGVTTIRGMLGQPSHIGLRSDLESGATFGPHLVTSGPSLNGRSVNGAEQARQLVREQHAAGYDFIKIHPGLTRDEFEAAAAAANELGMPFAGHVPVAAGVRRVLELGMATIDHLDGYFAELLPKDNDGEGGYGGFFGVYLADDIDAGQLAVIARETAEAGTWNVPTEVLVEQLVDTTPVAELRSRPEMRYMPAETVANWAEAKESQLAERDYGPELAMLAVDLRRRLIFELHRAGAGLLLGSDSPQIFNVPGFATHRELDALVAAGLSPYAALRTGTVAVAEFLGTKSGAVEVGRDADLVLLDANPLEDISNARRIHGVMLRGQWYPAADLEDRLAPYRRGLR